VRLLLVVVAVSLALMMTACKGPSAGVDVDWVSGRATVTSDGSLTLDRWDDASMTLQPSSSSEDALEVSEDSVLKPSVGSVSFKYYWKSEDTFEYEIILDDVPVTNVFSMPFTSRNLDFFYQPALNEGDECPDLQSNATDCWDENGIVRHGSYAVYHSSKDGNEYGTGKAFHIFRPFVTDANGDMEWAVMTISDDTLSITVSPEWLVNAAYPVIIDPTFGYTTVGGSSGSLNTPTIAATAKGGPASAAVTKYAYIYSASFQPEDVWVGLYTDSTGPSSLVSPGPVANLNTPAWGAASWKRFDMAGLPITGGSSYWVAAQSNTTSHLTIYYDVLAGTNRYWDTTRTEGSWASTFTQSSSSGAKYSFYAEYTLYPDSPSPTLTTPGDTNLTTQDLECNATITDPDGDNLNVTIRWYKGGVLDQTREYNDSYANNTVFSQVLGSGNLTANDAWICGIRLYDGYAASGWVNSSSLTVLAASSTCDCPASGSDWVISDASDCTITSACDIGSGIIRVTSGSLRVQAGVVVKAAGCYKGDNQSLFVYDTGRIDCG